MLQSEPLELLSKAYITNDLQLPVWIYKIENIVLTSRRFMKVYLMNRTGDGRDINRITFRHAEKEYNISDFQRVTKYDDSNYVGCVITLDLEDVSKDLTIVQEIIGGKIYEASERSCQFRMDAADSPREQYLKETRGLLVYPQIRKEYWLCSCGRIHGTEDIACACGKTLPDLQEILDFDFDTVAVEEYLKNPMEPDTDISFDENLNRYIAGFTQKYPDIPLEKLVAKLDTEACREKYEQTKQTAEAQKIKAQEKAAEKAQWLRKAKKLGGIAAAVIILLSAVEMLFKDQIMTRMKEKEIAKRILGNGPGTTFEYGSYEQDNNTKNGKEPIQWQVLEIEGDRVFVISVYGLEYKPYNDTPEPVTWETCTLRNWLNSDFFNSAFTAAEQKNICLMKVKPDHNQRTDQGNTTEDHIFLLSYPQAVTNIESKSDRKCLITDYVQAQSEQINGTTSSLIPEWLLRTMGESNTKAVFVQGNGMISNNGRDITEHMVIRPVMWVDLSK